MKTNISDVRIMQLNPTETEKSLVGYASCVINEAIYVSGIELHRDGFNYLVIKFPEKTFLSGKSRTVFKPLHPEIYAEIHDAILDHWEDTAY